MQPDEEQRENGLRSLRQKGYAVVLDEIARRRPLYGLDALDVGCGHGWFLEAAAKRGMRATGIEPDREVAARARTRGLNVRVGFFPQDAPAGERYDVITFNDVLEHLPDLPGVLAAARERLRPGGILAISVPTADGLGYRVATALARVGCSSPLDRLWQRGFPSPHLWYFTESSLTKLLAKHGFRPIAAGRLPSVERDGLWARVAADPRRSVLMRAAFAGVYLAAPILNHRRFSDALWMLCDTHDE